MDRVWKSGAVGAPPVLDNASAGYPVAGNPGTGTPATKPGPHWYHMVTEELLALIATAGVAFDKAVLTQLRDAVYAIVRGVVQVTAVTGTQNNFAVTAARRVIVRCSNASLVTFTGFAAGQDGDEILIYATAGGRVDIAHNSGSSVAANRILNYMSGTISLAAGSGRALLRYFGGVWNLVEHEQGAWITPTFNAGDYTASGAMTWTVTAPQQATFAYMVRGKTMSVMLQLNGTTIGGVPSATLSIALPGGFVVEHSAGGGISLLSNNAWTLGIWRVSATGNAISVQRGDTTPFATANPVDVWLSAQFEIQ
jgi:hypothetical protein